MSTEVIERNDGVTVIEIGIPGPQGPPGTLIDVMEEGVVVVTPIRSFDFGAGFDVTESIPRRATITLDLTEAPQLQAVTDALNAHEVDAVAAHNASAIAFTPSGTVTSADVQSAIQEVESDIAGIVATGHPNLATHDALGLATDADVSTAISAHLVAADPHTGYQRESEKAAPSGYASLDSGTKVPLGQIPTGTTSGTVALGNAAAVLDASHVAAADPHVGYQQESEKGTPSGYASLDSGGKVPTSQIPSVAFGQVFEAASQAAMLALAASPGDIAIRTDTSETFILGASPASTLGNWHELLSPAGGVTSVNTRTGAVTGVQDTAEKGSASGYASLDGSGVVPDAQLPAALARDSEVTSAVSTHAGLADPHTGYQQESEKGTASGYASLTSATKVPIAQIPTGTSSTTVALGDAAAALDAAHVAAADPHTGYQQESEKGAASGYASLDGSTKVPIAQVPTGTTGSTVALGNAAAALDAAHVAAADPHPTYETSAEAQAKVTTHEAAADPHTGYQKESERAAASGYASLDATTRVPLAQLPTGTTSGTVALGDAAAALDATHAAAADPHTGYQKESERAVASGYASLDAATKVPIAQIPTGTTSASVALGDAPASVVSTHVAAADPHPTYETSAEAQAKVDVHKTASTAAHTASAVTVTPVGTIGSTDVQAALAELDAAAGGFPDVTAQLGYTNVVDPVYGAIGDSTNGTNGTDDTTALNAAIAAANAGDNVLYFPPGRQFRITAPLNAIKSHMIGEGATIWFNPAVTSAGTAVTIGDGTSANVAQKIIRIPDIRKTTKYWSSTLTGTDTGLKMWSIVDSSIYIGRIVNFSVGVFGTGGTSAVPSSPLSYCSVWIRALENNKVNLRIDDGGTSYANEVNWYGGSFNHYSGTNNMTGCRHIEIHKTGANVPNLHRFYGATLEGNSTDYNVECGGSYNLFIGCRWESSPPKINWQSTGRDNVVWYGYQADSIVHSGNGPYNLVYTRSNMKLWGLSGSSGILQMSNYSGDASPCITIAPVGYSPLTQNMGTVWQTAISADNIAMKDTADTAFAVRMNKTGALEFGDKAGNVTGGLYQWAGSPNTHVTANKGALCEDTTNGTLYQKTTNAANTGWVAIATSAGTMATDTLWDAKGDLAVGTGADTAIKLTVGADDTILMADAAAATGLKWVASATPSTQLFGDAAAVGTADTFTRGDHKHAMPNGVSDRDGGLEAVNAVGNTGTAQTISLTSGNVITYTVNGNCTFTMPSGLPSSKGISFTVILTDSGGPRALTFTGVKWSGGADPTAMSAAGAIDIYTFLTIDGGTTWYGFVGGTSMAT